MSENDYGVSPGQSDESCAENKVDDCTQTERDVPTDHEPILVDGIEFGGITFGGNEYHDTYRNGNFGLQRGRVHLARAKIWSMAHLFTACTLMCFILACILLLVFYGWYSASNDYVVCFITLSLLCGFCALLTSCVAMCFSFDLVKLRRPLFSLLLVRVLALLECILLLPGIISTNILSSQATKYSSYFTIREDTNENVSVLIGLCSGLMISLVVHWFTALAWLFHWWKWCVCCQCLKSCCIFEPGEPLAPGVPDPPTGFLRECFYMCWMAICRNNWSLI